MAEEQLGKAGLKGDDGAVIDVAPGEVASAEEVVELVAEVAVADARFPEVGSDVQGELDGGEKKPETQGLAKRWIDGTHDGCVGGHGGVGHQESSIGLYLLDVTAQGLFPFVDLPFSCWCA